MNKKRILIAFVVVGLAAAGFAYGRTVLVGRQQSLPSLTQPPAARTGAAETATSADPGKLVASGTIKGHRHRHQQPERWAIGGDPRRRRRPGSARRSDRRVDTTLNEAQLNQAQTALVQAQAQVALLKAGTPPADIDVARAMVGQAKAAAAAAKTTSGTMPGPW